MDVPGQPPNRRFSGKGHQDHMVHSLYRYESLVQQPDAFLKLFRNIPFLNGGLFECLDERDESGETRVDGFSDHSKNPIKVPDFLFFGPDRRADLSQAYGELRYSQATVRPLIPTLGTLQVHRLRKHPHRGGSCARSGIARSRLREPARRLQPGD